MLQGGTEVALASLSEGERAALEAFRAGVPAVDTATALWFIRARKYKVKAGLAYDVTKSTKMYLAHLEWRKKFGTEQLNRDGPSMTPEQRRLIDSSFAPVLLRPYDLNGRPVQYLALGRLDTSSLEKQGVPIDLLMRRWDSSGQLLPLLVCRPPFPPLLPGTCLRWRSYDMPSAPLWIHLRGTCRCKSLHARAPSIALLTSAPRAHAPPFHHACKARGVILLCLHSQLLHACAIKLTDRSRLPRVTDPALRFEGFHQRLHELLGQTPVRMH